MDLDDSNERSDGHGWTCTRDILPSGQTIFRRWRGPDRGDMPRLAIAVIRTKIRDTHATLLLDYIAKTEWFDYRDAN